MHASCMFANYEVSHIFFSLTPILERTGKEAFCSRINKSLSLWIAVYIRVLFRFAHAAFEIDIRRTVKIDHGLFHRTYDRCKTGFDNIWNNLRSGSRNRGQRWHLPHSSFLFVRTSVKVLCVPGWPIISSPKKLKSASVIPSAALCFSFE